MKARSITILTIILAFAAAPAIAQSKNSKVNIKVYGNCAMCKKRIETALDSKGVKQAIWDTKTKELQVVYVPSKITEQEIHQLVAAVGHDTDKVKANDEVYAELPFCCLYRDHDHSGIKDEPHNH
jgi:periplasmic mercuric ion binding protein